ncbi:MAG: DUF3180 domain-containing protein [Micrococcaceae bacterium]
MSRPALPTLRPGLIVLILVLTAALGWVASYVTAERGWVTPVLGLTSVITIAAVVVVLLGLGLRVRRDRSRPVAARMNPVAAAQTVVLAQAGAYASAVIMGWHVGVVVHRVPLTGWGSVGEAVTMIATGLALLVVGCVVEQWCRITGDNGNNGNNGGDGTGPVTGPDGIPQAGRNRA